MKHLDEATALIELNHQHIAKVFHVRFVCGLYVNGISTLVARIRYQMIVLIEIAHHKC